MPRNARWLLEPNRVQRLDHLQPPHEGGVLRKLGEGVSEVLEYVPASFTVVRHVRPKLCCSGCDRIVQAPAASRPIERGIAGPGLLAHVRPNSRITCRCIARRRFTPAKVSTWIARLWPSG